MTDPTSAASRFRIKSVAREGDFLRLVWNSSPGCIYDVESSNDLHNYTHWESTPGLRRRSKTLDRPENKTGFTEYGLTDY